VTIKTQGLQTLEPIRVFLGGNEPVDCKVESCQEAYDLITETLRRFRYKTLSIRSDDAPYDKLKSPPSAVAFLKPEITFEPLDRTAYAMSDHDATDHSTRPGQDGPHPSIPPTSHLKGFLSLPFRLISGLERTPAVQIF
jgi:hypothetical protein